jgi:hypothetical protein
VDLQRIGVELADEATGRSHRRDGVLPGTGGPAGNARLTAWTGAILFVLFVAELVTLLDVHGLVSWHVALGVLLVPPALLKTASTGWRFVRYYARGRPDVEAGPPIMPLRVLGPVVIVTTLGLLGSGLVLIALGEQRSREDGALGLSWVNIHQGFFIASGIALGLHFLARAVPAWMLVTGRRKEESGAAPRVPGGAARLVLVALSLAVAGVTTALVLPAASSWQHEDFGHFAHVDRPPGDHDKRATGAD